MKPTQPRLGHILIVDDDVNFRLRTSAMLQCAGYEVSTADGGAEALDHLVRQERLPSLILLDLVMPGMDGWRFREIQLQHSKLWYLPVIAVADAPVDEKYAHELQSVGLLVKPLDKASLMKAISKALRVDRQRLTKMVFPLTQS